MKNITDDLKIDLNSSAELNLDIDQINIANLENSNLKFIFEEIKNEDRNASNSKHSSHSSYSTHGTVSW